MGYSYDAKVASTIKLKDIDDIARKAGIASKYLKKYGKYRAKVSAEMLKGPLNNRKPGKLIAVTSITPTYLGEGNTVTTIGLGMALNRSGKKAIPCICQPSLSPVFGLKGSAVGGGYAQVLPAEEITLEMQGDFHAVSAAQNLCASFLDNSLFLKNPLKINKDNIVCRRVTEIGDRSLRNISIGGGGKLHGVSRKSGIDILPACECMAILSLSESLKDLRTRLGRMIVAFSEDGKPVTADDLKVAGAMTVLMKESLSPNIVQTIEHTPCFVHAGTFANVSHGSTSVIGDMMALALADYAVVETGFGADMGLEKFIDIKCRQSGLKPDVIVVNCSIRGLKIHSGDYVSKTGNISADLKKENLSAVDRGCSNLEKQVENLKLFGVPIVVCLNKFESDTVKETDVVVRRAEALEVEGIAVSDVYRSGSKGGAELAKAVTEASKIPSKFRYLYPVDMHLKSKIERVAKSIYGASEVKYSDLATEKIGQLEATKLDQMTISMVKTPYSLSNNAAKKGRPRGFKLTVEDVDIASGAGYVLVACDNGENSMPALPKNPRGMKVDVDLKTGETKGLF
ncbi:MAG: formate--tetrahydrofolate ligase [Candidatus Omnitrophica bacterium]|nr:formate--tetrahydrofolate ligase [Candidatus Omnitrophota bacterium]MDD5488640.1 formate--tetrahydrofolate ligase [Candidatus Omnitrophota bacterium]